MHIRRVHVENIRRFGSGAGGIDIELPARGWIVVAGPNGSGKTTLLKVIALALSGALPHDFADTMFSWCRVGAKTARSLLTLVSKHVGQGDEADSDAKELGALRRKGRDEEAAA